MLSKKFDLELFFCFITWQFQRQLNQEISHIVFPFICFPSNHQIGLVVSSKTCFQDFRTQYCGICNKIQVDILIYSVTIYHRLFMTDGGQ